MRTLNFLETLPNEGMIVVGVVYPAGVPGAQNIAAATAQVISSTRGPNSRGLKPLLISSEDLAHFDGHLNALFLVNGVSKQQGSILDTMRRRQIPSFSDDPGCADVDCCVIFVRTGETVDISLNTALANAVGARFSLVFTMVVKRK